MTSSKGSRLIRDATGSVLVSPEGLGAQQREEDHVPDGRPVREEHGEPVDPHALAGGRRQSVLQRANVVLVEPMRLLVPRLPRVELLLEPPPLLLGIVQLR